MTKKVVVRFTEQQIELLEKLKKEGKFGANYGAIVLRLFREYWSEAELKGGV